MARAKVMPPPPMMADEFDRLEFPAKMEYMARLREYRRGVEMTPEERAAFEAKEGAELKRRTRQIEAEEARERAAKAKGIDVAAPGNPNANARARPLEQRVMGKNTPQFEQGDFRVGT